MVFTGNIVLKQVGRINSFIRMAQFFTEPAWPQSLTCLKNIDALLRCTICFDYIDIAMMIQQCSHNYCSLCIRKFLSLKSQCPLCNLTVTESDLRNNRVLDDLVKSFRSVRQQFLQIDSESPPKTPQAPGKVSRANCKGPIRKKVQENTLRNCFLQKANPVSSSKEAESQSSCTDIRPKTLLEKTIKEEPLEIPTGSASSMSSNPEQPSTSLGVKQFMKVECPACGLGISEQYINKHLDICLTKSEKKESLRRTSLSSSVAKRKPMAKVVYDLLSDRDLKKRLKALTLSTQGTRQQLIKRHQKYLQMYNAQCDSLNPKSAQEIVNEVEKNEKMMAQYDGQSNSVMVFSKNQTEEEIDEIHAQYRKQHKSEFHHLIEKVRGRWNSGKRKIKEEPIEEGSYEGECSTVLDGKKPYRDVTTPEAYKPKSESEVSLKDESLLMNEIQAPSSPSLSMISISRLSSPLSPPR
ncbi:E3 ubiquitin-protein ligase RAD18-like isoform X3 [Acipenser ruthenus]|uniref:E3 ubiquitin-protein ligase RAD18-like isoform X3 n=1 Tax=Acipenser ruthenus TaxID=7906 RepID=UPI00274162AE|nr:E3 ubiquitin-protein ligase RAD18-like isoform X3 [Acipenser ruthenus]